MTTTATRPPTWKVWLGACHPSDLRVSWTNAHDVWITPKWEAAWQTTELGGVAESYAEALEAAQAAIRSHADEVKALSDWLTPIAMATVSAGDGMSFIATTAGLAHSTIRHLADVR